jgi:hypothetical protein
MNGQNGFFTVRLPVDDNCRLMLTVSIPIRGETRMGDKGKKDKGKREQQKKAQVNPKEKRKLKKEKNK